MEQKVLIPSDISQPGKDYLRERGYVIKMGRGIDEQTIMEDAADCDALLARNEHITRGIMEAAPHLKVISKHGVGLDKIDLDAARDLNIWVTNGPLSNTVAVAEHTMMLILACAKKLVLFDKAIRNGDYEIRNRVKGMDLEGKTLGLLGLGKIGHMVAKKAINGFGMKVLGYDPFLPADRWDPEVRRCETMEEIFSGSDIVSIHMPSTPETRNSVDARLIGMMKPTAYLINAARGDLIREEDLIEALKNNAIAGAGLDVYPAEPPSPEDPLFQLPNVVVTPHNAALTIETTDRMGLHAAMGIDEVLSGKQPTWPVVVPKEPRK
ncbi:hydroxyacid dehydrogenase [Oscillibacter valericigenes]|uniref:hydroxyacid dehydrogenase n=1 Tax=Oscillibacter valericigenes TaxID=351091 RepID=UPI00195C11CB|nr:hydroxyacid dehydrogenase [Oscillibacter valericigenes]MBM6911174.1 hydroxyacid dehydrogenase [Oscillibacter valericigenes]